MARRAGLTFDDRGLGQHRSGAEQTLAKAPRSRLDDLLLEQGLLPDLKTAQGWIMAGKVVVDGKVVTTPGTRLPETADVHLRDLPLRFASRGGYKLERALDEFSIVVAGLTCLDAGACTGGFTDCLLQRGAATVHAVEVGYGQLRGRLASDPRVLSRERTNIGALAREDLVPPIDFAAADLSYLSLAKAVPILAALFERPLHAVCLVKPLYEGLDQGRMTEAPALEATLARLLADLDGLALPASGLCVSPILGGRGAVEFLAHFQAGRRLEPEVVLAQGMADLARRSPLDFAAFWRLDQDNRPAGDDPSPSRP